MAIFTSCIRRCNPIRTEVGSAAGLMMLVRNYSSAHPYTFVQKCLARTTGSSSGPPSHALGEISPLSTAHIHPRL
ncbi:hypothetical protein NL676_008269 [Syzygium grande]|nr:hypothetical protein NL676_008269 [Syzygium grande]